MTTRHLIRAALALLAGWVLSAGADPEVTSLDLVSSERVGRTLYEYTYRIRVDNDLPGLDSAVANVTSTNPATTIVEGEVTLGDLAIGATTSVDTFTLRHDRTVPFDPDALVWEFTADIRLTISGQVRDEPIGDAAVILSVEGTGLMSFSTTADSSGAFLESVEGTGLQDFVSIEATGTGDQEFVTLNSYAGSMSSLLAKSADPGRSARGGVAAPVVTDVNVTHITTALRVLADEAHGGPISSQPALESASAMVNTADLIEVATLIKTVVDNADIGLPGGIENTLELARSPRRSEFSDFVAATFPEAYMAALSATVDEVGSSGFTPGDIPPVIYLNVAGDALAGLVQSTINVFRAEFDDEGPGGTITNRSGTFDMVSSISASGELVLDLTPPVLLFESFVNIPDFGVVLEQTFLDRVTLERYDEEPRFDRVYELATTRRTYPETGGDIPDVITVAEPGPGTARQMYGPDGIDKFLPVELDGSAIGVAYYHFDNDSPPPTTGDSTFGFDVLNFAGDGTGTTRRRGFAFTYSIDSLGRLIVDFASGDSNEVVRLTDEDTGVASGVVVGTLVEGSPRASRLFTIVEDPVSFDGATLSNRRLRAGWTGDALLPTIFDFVFFPDMLACRNPGELAAPDFHWEIAAGRVQIEQRWAIPAFGDVAWLRTWEPLRRNGDKFWVHETLEFDPSPAPFRDPATTPGRANSYVIEQDLGDNGRPSAVDDGALTDPGVALNLFAADLLANDSDPEDDELLLVDFDRDSRAGGRVVPLANELFGELVGLRYEPPFKFIGADEFDYVASDIFCRPRTENDVRIAIDPRQTYLQTHPGDTAATDAVAIDLSGLGLAAGDVIRIDYLGDYSLVTGDPVQGGFVMTAVFSTSDVLGEPGAANRVPGALNVGDDWVTLAGDIPEDFLVTGQTMRIPDGARYLFVSPDDSFFGDNSDPDDNFALGISAGEGSVATVDVLVGKPRTRPLWRKPVRPDPGGRRTPVIRRDR